MRTFLFALLLFSVIDCVGLRYEYLKGACVVGRAVLVWLSSGWGGMATESSTIVAAISRDLGSDAITNGVRVVVRPKYLRDRSEPELGKFTWSYHITIKNIGDRHARLLRRHWVIVDGNGQRHEVAGEGVVGHQPDLSPGEDFEYASCCPLEYPWGTMEGEYTFVDERGELFEVKVGRFFLVSPHV